MALCECLEPFLGDHSAPWIDIQLHRRYFRIDIGQKLNNEVHQFMFPHFLNMKVGDQHWDIVALHSEHNVQNTQSIGYRAHSMRFCAQKISARNYPETAFRANQRQRNRDIHRERERERESVQIHKEINRLVLNIECFPSENLKVLSSLHQKSRESVGQHGVHTVNLLDFDRNTNRINRAFDQNAFVLIPG